MLIVTVITVSIFIIQGRLRMIIIIIIITYILSQTPSICLEFKIFIPTLVRNIIPIEQLLDCGEHTGGESTCEHGLLGLA